MDVKIGKGVASFLEKELLRAKKRVIVVSPWIGRRYAEILKELSSRLEVTLVTQEKNNEGLKVLKKVYLSKKDVLILIITTLSSLILLGWGMVLPSTLLLLVELGYIFLLVRRRLPSWVKINNNLHAKIYVVDNKIYFTSANLTSSGLKNNVEFIIEVPFSKELEIMLDKLFR